MHVQAVMVSSSFLWRSGKNSGKIITRKSVISRDERNDRDIILNLLKVICLV